MMTEEELREIERLIEPDAYSAEYGKIAVRRLIAEVRRLQVGDVHMKATGVLHVVCQCEKCVSAAKPESAP